MNRDEQRSAFISWQHVLRAVARALRPIVLMGVAYAVAVATGMSMAHLGHERSLAFRDRLVARAHQEDPASIAHREGRRAEAAIWDFSRNVAIGAVPTTLMGFAVVLPYGTAAYRGWVGGIVSVDRQRRSRLVEPGKAVSYLVTLVLQLIPYTLAGGAGVHLGLTYFRRPEYYDGRMVIGYPLEAFKDVVRIYALIIPLFFVASLWEFLNPWA